MTPEQRLRIMPVSCRGIYKAAMTGKSRAKAVKAFCQKCVGYDRKSIRDCTDPGCPLYPYRPHRLKDFEKEEEEEGEEDVGEDVDEEEEDVVVKKTPPIPIPMKKKKLKKKRKKQPSSLLHRRSSNRFESRRRKK